MNKNVYWIHTNLTFIVGMKVVELGRKTGFIGFFIV